MALELERLWITLVALDPMTRPVCASSFLTQHCDDNTDFCSRVCRTLFLHCGVAFRCTDACRCFLISCPGTSALLPAFGHYDPCFDGLLRMYEILSSLPDCVQSFFPASSLFPPFPPSLSPPSLPRSLPSFLHSCLLLGRKPLSYLCNLVPRTRDSSPQPSCWEGAASLHATGEH